MAPTAPTATSPRAGGRPLGATPRDGAAIRTDDLAEGEVVLLYTDGLIESPSRPLDSGRSELAAAGSHAIAQPAAPDPFGSKIDEVCERVVEIMERPHGYTDDVTVLAAERRLTAVEPLRREVEADLVHLDDVRDGVLLWVAPLGAGYEDQIAFSVLAVEAFTNAVEHSEGTRVALDLALAADGTAQLEVGDDGHWKEGDGSGVGLRMIERLSDSLTIERDEAGTCLRARRRIARPLLDRIAGRIVPPRAVTPFGIAEDTEVEPPVLRLRGSVDALAAPRLAERLGALSQARTRGVVVDLSEVTLLSSAGVRVLQEHTGERAGRAAPVELLAPPGTPARLVAELTGLAVG